MTALRSVPVRHILTVPDHAASSRVPARLGHPSTTPMRFARACGHSRPAIRHAQTAHIVAAYVHVQLNAPGGSGGAWGPEQPILASWSL
jgi:hypothetical protein